METVLLFVLSVLGIIGGVTIAVATITAIACDPIALVITTGSVVLAYELLNQ